MGSVRPGAKPYLSDMLSACEAIETFTANYCFEQYAGDQLVKAAVERKLITLGSALVFIERAHPEVAKQIPDARRIIAMGENLLRNNDTVDDFVIWRMISSELGEIKFTLRSLLDS